MTYSNQENILYIGRYFECWRGDHKRVGVGQRNDCCGKKYIDGECMRAAPVERCVGPECRSKFEIVHRSTRHIILSSIFLVEC